jgi:protein-disulfide isomerase
MRKPNLNNNYTYISIVAVVLIISTAIFYISGSDNQSNSVWRESAPSIGNADAPIYIVEFGSFTCESCVGITQILNQLITENPSKVKYQFRYFPDELSSNSIIAAEYAEIANSRGKFWEMYDMLMQNQENWINSNKAKDVFLNFLQLVGANENINGKINDAQRVVDNDLKFAKQNDLVGTPTLFINGKLYSKDLTYSAIKDEIDSALK